MKTSVEQQKKHRGLGGGGLSKEADEQIKNSEPTDPGLIHNGYMRNGIIDSKKEKKDPPKP